MRAAALFFALVVAACCPAAERAKPDVYDYRSDYVLSVQDVELALGDGAVQALDGVDIDATSEHGEFSIRVRNAGRGELIVLFGEAKYVDETGSRHDVNVLSGAEGDPACDPLRLASGKTGFCSLVPAAKDYKVRESCFVDFVYREPIIPWPVADLSKKEAREAARQMAQKRVLVGVEIPIVLRSRRGHLIIRSRLVDHPYREWNSLAPR